jgi:ADP-ribose pyrophosphatase YjhB (NUDIX family)
MVLSNTYYYGNHPILVAVDNIIFGFDLIEERLKVLLFKRLVEPYAGEWSLIGSFVQDGQDIDDAAANVLKELTGITDVYLEQLKTYGNANRDTGERVISIAYYSLLKLQDDNAQLRDQHDSFWFDIAEVPELVLDHSLMVKDAIRKLKIKARRSPIGFELLPEKFTLRQFKSLYEQIYQAEIDDRNFRKKILATGLLDKLEEKDKTTSKKGAFLYTFNKEKYDEYLNRGFDIQFH